VRQCAVQLPVVAQRQRALPLRPYQQLRDKVELRCGLCGRLRDGAQLSDRLYSVCNRWGLWRWPVRGRQRFHHGRVRQRGTGRSLPQRPRLSRRALCSGLAATCGPSGNADCCASSVVTGGTFNRGNDPSYPATVSDFRLDTYEITVGRFRKFWSSYPGYPEDMPSAGSGKNPNNAGDPGWAAVVWNSDLPASQALLTTNISCDSTYQTWTAGNDALPMSSGRSRAPTSNR